MRKMMILISGQCKECKEDFLGFMHNPNASENIPLPNQFHMHYLIAKSHAPSLCQKPFLLIS